MALYNALAALQLPHSRNLAEAGAARTSPGRSQKATNHRSVTDQTDSPSGARGGGSCAWGGRCTCGARGVHVPGARPRGHAESVA